MVLDEVIFIGDVATFVGDVVLCARDVLTLVNKNFNAFGSLLLFVDFVSSGFAHKLSFLITFSKIASDFLFLVIDAGGMSEYCMTPLLSRQR